MAERIKALINNIPRFSDDGQRRAFSGLLRFFALLMVLTLIARSAAASMLPVVRTTAPARAEIAVGYSGYAFISQSGTFEIFAPEGLKILEIYASAGQYINAGDPVARFDKGEVENKLTAEIAALDKLNLEMEKLSREENTDVSFLESAGRALDRAKEDYETVKRQCSNEKDTAKAACAEAEKNLKNNPYFAAVTAAEKTYQTAVSERETVRDNAEKAVAAAKEAVVSCENEYAAALPGPEKDAAETRLIMARAALADAEALAAVLLSAADNEVLTAQSILLLARQNFSDAAGGKTVETLQTEYEQKRAALAAAEEREREVLLAAERRVEDAEDSLAKARADIQKNQIQTADLTEQNRISAVSLKLDIDRQKNTVELLGALYDGGGVMYSDIQGEVVKTTEEGETNDKIPLLTMIDNQTGFEAILSLDEDETDVFAVGDECQVSVRGGNLYYTPTVTGVVKSVSQPDAASGFTVVVKLEEGDFKKGQKVEVRMVTSREVYGCSVPISAIHSDNTGYFIYIVDTKVTVLGAVNLVSRVPVSLLATDGERAAIEGPVGHDAKVIVAGDKAFESGDRVRVTE